MRRPLKTHIKTTHNKHKLSWEKVYEVWLHTSNLAVAVEVMWAVLPPSCSLKQSVKGSRRPMAKILEQSLSASSGSSCCCCRNSFSRRVRPGQPVMKTRLMWLVYVRTWNRFMNSKINCIWSSNLLKSQMLWILFFPVWMLQNLRFVSKF